MVSTIDHKIRKGLELSMNEYLVADIIQRSSYGPYSTLGKKEIAELIDVTTPTVSSCIDTLEDYGVVEVINRKPLNVKVTDLWVNSHINREVDQEEVKGEVKAVGVEAIEYLNTKLGKGSGYSYEPYKGLFKKIFSKYQQAYPGSGSERVRLAIRAVIDHKIVEWGEDQEMFKYLRPSTLFGNKFMTYLDAARVYWKNR